MSTTESTDYEAILQIVREWPPARRFTLVQDVLKTLVPAEAREQPHHPTLEKARGLLTDGRPAPTDEEIARWLEEHRQERYGI
jgi:hypothetical protein